MIVNLFCIKIVLTLPKDDSVKEAASLALSQLANNEECAQLVFKLNGVAYAAQLLGSPRVSLQVQTLKYDFNIFYSIIHFLPFFKL